MANLVEFKFKFDTKKLKSEKLYKQIHNELDRFGKQTTDEIKKTTLNATFSYKKGKKKRTFGTKGLIKQSGKLSNSLNYKVDKLKLIIGSNKFYGMIWEKRGGNYKWFEPVVLKNLKKLERGIENAIKRSMG